MKIFILAPLLSIVSLVFVTSSLADNTKGLGVYMNFCAPCHASGVAGAPKVGDKAEWKARTTKGPDEVVKLAINGFQGTSGFMPAKGGNSALTDEEVTAATLYMLEQSK